MCKKNYQVTKQAGHTSGIKRVKHVVVSRLAIKKTNAR